jgi:hypothetical protein
MIRTFRDPPSALALQRVAQLRDSCWSVCDHVRELMAEGRWTTRCGPFVFYTNLSLISRKKKPPEKN